MRTYTQVIYTEDEREQIAQALHGQRVTLEGLTGVVASSDDRIELHLDDETLSTEAYQVNAAAMGGNFYVWDFGEIDELVRDAYQQVTNEPIELA